MFYAIGFIIESAHQSLLGIPIEPGTGMVYLMTTGQFALDVSVLVLRWVADLFGRLSLLWSLTAVLGSGIALTLLNRSHLLRNVRSSAADAWLQARAKHRHVFNLTRHPSIIRASLMVIAFAVVAAYALPLVPLEDFLFRASFDAADGVKSGRAPWLIGERAHRVYWDLVCSRNASHSNCAQNERIRYKRRLENRLVIHFLFTAIVTLAGMCFLGRSRVGSPVTEATTNRSLWDGVVAVALVLTGLTVPYAYGKMIKSTELPEVVVDCDKRANCPGIPVRGNEGNELHAFILSQREKSVILWDKHLHYVWELPRENVRVTKIERLSDVLESRIRSWKTLDVPRVK